MLNCLCGNINNVQMNLYHFQAPYTNDLTKRNAPRRDSLLERTWSKTHSYPSLLISVITRRLDLWLLTLTELRLESSGSAHLRRFGSAVSYLNYAWFSAATGVLLTTCLSALPLPPSGLTVVRLLYDACHYSRRRQLRQVGRHHGWDSPLMSTYHTTLFLTPTTFSHIATNTSMKPNASTMYISLN